MKVLSIGVLLATQAAQLCSASTQDLVYEALRKLNPNTLNLTIYWSCVSTNYTYLSEFGEMQKNDVKYGNCSAAGNYLYERSCLHNILTMSNCVDGTWDCGSQWNPSFAVNWLSRVSRAYPQCFTNFSTIPDSPLTWTCEEKCDLPCSYPAAFCSTIQKSYNVTRCEMTCGDDVYIAEDEHVNRSDSGGRRLDSGGRRLSEAAMTLQIGSSGDDAVDPKSDGDSNDPDDVVGPESDSTAADTETGTATSSSQLNACLRQVFVLLVLGLAMIDQYA